MIVTMRKMTFIGLKAEKEIFMKRLQEAGVTHLILPPEGAEPQELAKELQKVGEVRKFLARRAPKVRPEVQGDAVAICARREELAQLESRLGIELAQLRKERALLAPWGDFSIQDLALLRAQGLVVQFYRASARLLAALPLENVFHFIAAGGPGETPFVTITREPLQLGLLPDRMPERSLGEVQRLLGEKEQQLKDIQAEYGELAQRLAVLERAEAELTDEVAYRRALLNADSELQDRLFVLKCWSAATEEDLVKSLGADLTFFHYAQEPEDGDRVPVLLANKPAFAPGEDLVSIYSHPNYSDFDPSGIVFYSFAFFYGMIIGDAGYGVVLTLLTVWLHRKIKDPSPTAKRMIFLSYLLGGSTIFFGLITASYFGIALDPGNPLTKIMLMDFSTKEGQSHAMLVSIIMGMIHISIALCIKLKRSRDLPSLGWLLVMWSGLFVLQDYMKAAPIDPVAMWIMIAGFGVVVLFTSDHKNFIIRILAGLNGALGAIQLFADVLSYMRLFALGLATMYMCQTFNMLGGMTSQAVPYVGFIFGALVLVCGHAINIVLGIMGGVVHGLRLNFLEWYRWCFEGDGLPFKPFRQIAKRV